MDAFVDDLLVEWGFGHLVEPFKVQQIDFEALVCLDSDELKTYIPEHGPRLKFLRKLKLFQEQASGNVQVLLVETPTDSIYDASTSTSSNYSSEPTSFSPDGSELSNEEHSAPSTPAAQKRDYKSMILNDTLVETAIAKLNVLEVLKKDTICAKTIQKLQEGQSPSGDWRKRVVDVLVTTSLLQISENLSLPQLKVVAGKLAEALPGESIETYYLDSDPPLRKFVTGKLVDKYRNRKRPDSDNSSKLAKRSRGGQSKDCPPESDASYTKEEVSDALKWLEYNRAPWPQVLVMWDKTYNVRMSEVFPRPSSKKESKVFNYFDKYPVLKAPAGYQLLIADFARRYPEKSAVLYSKWPAFEAAILLVAKQEAKDPFAKNIVRELETRKENNTLTENSRILLHLMLLPYLFKSNASVPIDPNLVSAAGKKSWKPSLAESRNGFILHVKHANDIKSQLESRQDFMKRLGLSCQPIIIVCGPLLTEVTHYHLSVDNVMYHVPGPLQAVDYLFKFFQALHCWYPVEAEQVWLFLQIEIYNIRTQFDNFPTVNDFASHLRNDHSAIINATLNSFKCNQQNPQCHRVYDTLNSLCCHLRKDHRVVWDVLFNPVEQPVEQPVIQPVEEPLEQPVEQHDEQVVIDDENEGEQVNHGPQNGAFGNINDFIEAFSSGVLGYISKLYSIPHTNRAMVQLILEATSEYILGHMQDLHGKVERLLANLEGNEAEKELVMQMFSVIENPFQRLETEHKRFSILADSNLLLNPQSYVMGEYNNVMIRIDNGLIPAQKTVYGYGVPMRHTIKQFLELPGVLQQILENIAALNQEVNIVSNVIQGSVWQEYAQDFGEKLVLPINISYDDFVPDHVLLAHAGEHELGPVYCTIPVIPQKYLGALENKFVAALMLTKHRKHFGNEAAFHFVISDLEFLYNEGIIVQTENGNFRIYFCLLCVLGDNKGVNEICGFSGSFSANFYCRFCKEHRDTLKFQTVLNPNLLRTPENYEVDVAAQNFAATGVHEQCVWNAAPKFHCTKGVCGELLHDLCEGDLWFCMSRILWCLIYEQGYFTLQTLIDRSQGFTYGPLESGNKPPVFNLTQDKLRSENTPFAGAEMLCFVRNLGEIIGDCVPEDDVYWEFYLSHRKLIDIIFKPLFVRGTENYVGVLVEEHHATFLRLFNEPLKPKQHMMSHYKLNMLRFGRLVNLWCMRDESKHRELKDYATSSNSRIQLPLTVFIQVQLKFCQRLISKRGFSHDIKSGPSKCSTFQNIDHFVQCNGIRPNGMEVCREASWVKVFNLPFQKGLCLLINIEDGTPVFGEISSVLLSDPTGVSFIVKILNTTHFDNHTHVYVVEPTLNYQWVRYDDLVFKMPFFSRLAVNGNRVVSFRYL
ncbi:putative hemoglobin and hemoglobin-haptoglobin-binding protein 3 [Frankliniella fusca]|uniref:Hemoglobin and hemoglobin-haptoglobin-binding protein 3 n=1 Tax=Frankliniella fusca TaxID=407009 RepID=A0AAE1LBJ2_9NEOP|nr:putative hemoglobin and hemoglobin-haptoglobin-binding protein 3 [Frankliniella fusca]